MDGVMLNRLDRASLLAALGGAFHTADRMTGILTDIGFPPERIPLPSGGSIEDDWRAVLRELDLGVLVDGYRALLRSLVAYYPANPIFRRLAETYLAAATKTERVEELACRVLVQRDDDDEAAIVAALTDGGVAAERIRSTDVVTVLRLDTPDDALVRRILEQTGLNWTVVPPGRPDYLLSSLIVTGPDGRQFRFTDVPVQEMVGSVAEQLSDQYGAPRPTVIDRVMPDGRPERVNPDQTLAEAGFQDGESIRIGFEARAGGINPVFRSEALNRARHQMAEFAATHPDAVVMMSPPGLPTSYEVEFRAPGLAPPPVEGGDPIEIDRHVVSILLSADYPVVAPIVYWLSSVFHPNVFPNYDCPEAVDRPDYRGIVCLGELAEAYRPDMDLAELCRQLADLASYRNYSLLEATDANVLTANFFDRRAAAWAYENQERIVLLSGWPARRKLVRRGGVRPGVEGLSR